MQRIILALGPCDQDLDDFEIFDGICITHRNVEQAGEPFHQYSLRKLGLIEDEEPEEDGADGDDQNKGEDHSAFDKDKMKNKKKKKEHGLEGIIKRNHYEVLGIAHIGFAATEKDVRKAHRKLVLIHHPDKMNEEDYNELAKARWLEIQEAYETLIDAEKKMKYDSTIEFDEYIPEAKEYTAEEFFEQFAPVFKRNAHFSKKQPVPDIGTPKDDIKKVLRFYDFWYSQL